MFCVIELSLDSIRHSTTITMTNFSKIKKITNNMIIHHLRFNQNKNSLTKINKINIKENKLSMTRIYNYKERIPNFWENAALVSKLDFLKELILSLNKGVREMRILIWYWIKVYWVVQKRIIINL